MRALAAGVSLLFMGMLPGCEAELAVLVSMGLGTGLGAWMWGREKQQHALSSAQHLELAAATGEHREIEYALRKQLALAAGGHGVSPEREWRARLELGALLTAEWRLDEARALYLAERKHISPEAAALVELRIIELNALSHVPDQPTLETVLAQQERAKPPLRLRWRALEGLCLARMGRAREATVALEQGLESLTGDPMQVVYSFYLGRAYETIGERQLAAQSYAAAASFFPGTRTASEAASRERALAGSADGGPFRSLLPAGDDLSAEATPREKPPIEFDADVVDSPSAKPPRGRG